MYYIIPFLIGLVILQKLILLCEALCGKLDLFNPKKVCFSHTEPVHALSDMFAYLTLGGYRMSYLNIPNGVLYCLKFLL